jgi:hypothetical protein
MASEAAIVEVARARRVGFYVVVVAALGLVVFGLGELLFLGVVGWAGESALEEMTEPGAQVHLFHLLAHALFAWLLLISLATQLRHPKRRFAAAVFAVAAMITYSLGTLVSGVFDPLEVAAIVLLAAVVWLSPGREHAEITPLHRRVLLAAIPILAAGVLVAVAEVGRQVSDGATDEHAEFGHYGLMAAMAVIVVLAALIGSTSLPGRRMVAWLTVGSLVYLAVASMLFSNQVSSLGVTGGVVALAMGLLYGWGVLSARESVTQVAQ